MSAELTDAHLEELEAKGYVIVPGFYTGERLGEMQAAQRRSLPTWDEVKDDPPQGRAILTDFPPPEIALLRGIVDQSGVGICPKVAQDRTYPFSCRLHDCPLSRFQRGWRGQRCRWFTYRQRK